MKNKDTNNEAGNTIILSSGKLEQLQEYLANRHGRPEVIKQATIVDGHKLNVQWTVEINNGVDTTTKKCSAPVHDDLRIAFARLNNHLGLLCYQPIMEANPLHKGDKALPAKVCNIHCDGFKVTGNEGNEGVVLFGTRTLPNAKTLDLQSPSQRYEGDIYEYEESRELRDIIADCIMEVELYLFEGKHQPDVQGDLFAQEEEDQDPE